MHLFPNFPFMCKVEVTFYVTATIKTLFAWRGSNNIKTAILSFEGFKLRRPWCFSDLFTNRMFSLIYYKNMYTVSVIYINRSILLVNKWLYHTQIQMCKRRSTSMHYLCGSINIHDIVWYRNTPLGTKSLASSFLNL